MPAIKEPNYFSFAGEALNCRGPGAEYINNSITELQDYQDLFGGAPDGAIIGEASPLYLFSQAAPARIHQTIPKAKLVVILRNPIEQAFSHYLYATKQAIETEADFVKALELETERVNSGWQPLFAYSQFPRYGEQMARYLQHFPREQIFIRSYEDYQNRPQDVLRHLFEFIGADASFAPDMSRRANAGGVPKNRALQDFLMKSNPVTRAIGLVVPQRLRLAIRDRIAAANVKTEITLPPEAREILKERLRSDIGHLSELLDQDYSHWLE